MAKIKIKSNPYQKTTEFKSWDEAANDWKNIDIHTNPNSPLLRNELVIGFFPFKAKQIIDVIIGAYHAGSEKVDIVFEGTDDEYRELESICSGEDYVDKVSLHKSSKYLENARDILPDVIDVFKELSPLVSESVSDKSKIQRELEKFSDASNDIIPICVIGNYSSGKSTFINALIGYELLPSSDEPTTAKIYKISQSKHPDRAVIKFEFECKSVRIRFTAESYKFVTDHQDNPLAKQLKKVLDEIESESIPMKLNRVLDVINAYANRSKGEAISDLIEIEAPFDDDGIWGKVWNNFVIFDTPGSNSASNVNHYHVLKKAMEDLSNGLPIFVSEYDSLDSTDNDKLYQDINNMAELDNRFTMIIVNKADGASLKKNGLTEDDRERILSLAIPKKMYAGGLYFVSSIMGLGAKNDQDFFDDHNAEIFDDQSNKYTNPDSRFYKQLYRYNIMPEQIKIRYDELCTRHKNLLYANSGLYSVEQAIETFASVYSHYNKCQQSQLFLGKVIQITSDEIAAATTKREEYRERIHANLEKEKNALITTIEQQSQDLEAEFLQDYAGHMAQYVDEANATVKAEALKAQEAEFLRVNAEAKGVEERRSEMHDSMKSFGDHFVENFSKAFKDRSLSSFKKIGTDFSDGLKDIIDNAAELNETRRDVDRASSDELISAVRDLFTTYVTQAQSLLEEQSRAYWAMKTVYFKNTLSQTVTQSSALTDQERSELAGIIIQYQALAFENRAESIFDKAAFVHKIFGDVNRLNIDKLAKRFNSEMQTMVQEIYETFERSHVNSFNVWMNSLLDTVIENIVEFSPQLHNQAEIIKEETARIAELEFRKLKLSDYTEQIRRMMDWKES